MRSKQFRIYFGVLACLGFFLAEPFRLFALAPIKAAAIGGRLDITKSLELERDSSAGLTFDQIRAAESRFALRPGGDYDLGYTHDAAWLRFELSNDSKEPIERLLEYDYPPINRVELFTEGPDGRWSSQVLGNQAPFAARPVSARNPVFDLRLDPGRSVTYYAKVSTAGTLDIRLVLWDPSAFYAHERDMQLFYGLFFGIIITMGIYNLFLYIYSRDPANLAYLAFTLCFSFFVATIRGFGFEYLFPELPAFNKVSMPLSIGLSDLTGALFTWVFMSTRRDSPVLDKVLRIFMLGAVAVIGSSFFLPYSFITPAAAALTFPLTAILFATGIAGLARGNRSARFYTIAWGALLAGVFLTAMHAFGALQASFLTSFGLEIGTAAQVVLLSISLADKFYLAQSLNDELKERALMEQRATAESFSRFVPHEYLEALGKGSVVDIALGDNVALDMTVMFADIRQFSLHSERLSPEETFRFLNRYLSFMGPPVRAHGGFVDKFIGDGIMALFPGDPEDALRCGIDMQRRLRDYNAERAAAGGAPIRIGIGIHTGRLMLGTIGENERMDGTVISDAVNIANRIERSTKEFAVVLAVSERLLQKVKDRSAYQTASSARSPSGANASPYRCSRSSTRTRRRSRRRRRLSGTDSSWHWSASTRWTSPRRSPCSARSSPDSPRTMRRPLHTHHP